MNIETYTKVMASFAKANFRPGTPMRTLYMLFAGQGRSLFEPEEVQVSSARRVGEGCEKIGCYGFATRSPVLRVGSWVAARVRCYARAGTERWYGAPRRCWTSGSRT